MMTRDILEPGLSIVIPTWNGRHLLEKYLPTVIESAAAFTHLCHQPTEIVITDDASTDDTQTWLAQHYPPVRVETATRQGGFALNANRGVQAARFPLVYLVNNDVALTADTLPALVQHFSEKATRQSLFAATGQVYDYDTGVLSGAGQLGTFQRGFLRIHQRYFSPESALESIEKTAPFCTIFATGGSTLYHRERFLQLGGFDPLFSPFGWEDVELSLRAWRAGLTVHYEPRSAVWHQFSSTIKPAFRQRQIGAIYERNRLLTHWLHLDTPLQIANHLLFLSLSLLGHTLLGRWERWNALRQALSRLGEVAKRRRAFAAEHYRSLSTLLALVGQERHRSDVQLLSATTAPHRVFPPQDPRNHPTV